MESSLMIPWAEKQVEIPGGEEKDWLAENWELGEDLIFMLVWVLAR